MSVFLRRLRRRFLRGGFLRHVLICIAKQSGQVEFQNEPVEPLPRASTVRAPTHTLRSTTSGQGLGADLENVITVEPVGNQMLREGGVAGDASHELPNNGALTTARDDRSHCHKRRAASRPMVRRIVLHRESCLGVMQRTLETMAGLQRLQED